ncbi:MAG: hypothetical protein J6S41_00635, partial [Clostridia bacterium]|nr:hypothetical protein [Clostridia bacterium]
PKQRHCIRAPKETCPPIPDKYEGNFTPHPCVSVYIYVQTNVTYYVKFYHFVTDYKSTIQSKAIFYAEKYRKLPLHS